MALSKVCSCGVEFHATSVLESQIVEITHCGSPTLVAIPGGPGLSSNTLRLGVGELFDRIRVVLVNPPGTGAGAEQPDFARISQSLDQAYELVNASICNAIQGVVRKDEPVFILGHSYGGLHAIDCAIAMAGSLTIAGVILVASPFTAVLFKTLGNQIAMLGSPLLLKRRAEYFDSPGISSYRRLCAAYGPLLQGVSSSVGELVSAHLSVDECCGGALAGYAKAFRRQLFPSALQIPALAILGELDRLVPLSIAHDECRLAGVERVCVIPNAGHFPFIDSPELYGQEILRWLNE